MTKLQKMCANLKLEPTLTKLRTLVFNFIALIFITIILASCSKGSKDKPVLLEKKDLLNITGSISITDYNFTTAKLYNGTAWTLTDVDVEVSRPEKGRIDEMITRRFRLNVSDTDGQYFKPFKYGEFEEKFGDFLDGIDTNDTKNSFSWVVVSARGFKE